MERRMNQNEEQVIFHSPENADKENEHNRVIKSDEHEDQKKKIDHMRAILEKQDPASKDVDDRTLKRFLRARNLDVEKATAMFMKYVTWRRGFAPEGSISKSEVTKQISHNKMFMQGTDRKGRPIAVFFGARHNPNTEQLKRFAVFSLDKLCSRVPDGEDTFVIIVDLKGYGYRNSDVRGFIPIISILQNYYPERLEKLMFIHVPYIFMTAYKVAYPFIDKKTRDKIVFIENSKVEAALREVIDESQLPEMYGGKLELVPIQDA